MYCTTSAWSVTFVWVHSCNTCCSHSKCGSNYLSICVNNTCHQGYKAMWKAHQHLLTLCQITHSMPRLDNMYKVNSHKYSQSECSHDMLVSMWNGIVVATLNMPVVLCQGKKWEPTALGRVGSRYPSQGCTPYLWLGPTFRAPQHHCTKHSHHTPLWEQEYYSKAKHEMCEKAQTNLAMCVSFGLAEI
jgi:hypothetical protein